MNIIRKFIMPIIKKMVSATKKFIRKDLGSWLIMLPSIGLFLFYIWIPLFNNINLSFYETRGMTKVTFVGLEQYASLFKDPIFQRALENTFQYLFWSIIIGFLIPIILALILNEVVHLRGFFRAVIYFPNIIPGIAIVILWAFLFDPNDYGILNSLFGTHSLWLDDQNLVIPLIVLTMTWKGAGATALIYLATLQTIDPIYYEAARIEGANAWQRFRHVTLPHLMSQVKILFILQIISVFQVFYEPLVMTDIGGPDNRSMSLVLYIYQLAFPLDEPGKAAALSVIVTFFLFAMTAVYFIISRPRRSRRLA
jgi:multiple sugar transport system permease protein